MPESNLACRSTAARVSECISEANDSRFKIWKCSDEWHIALEKRNCTQAQAKKQNLQTVTYQAAFMEAHVAVPIQVAQKGNLGVMQHLSLVIEHRVEGVVVLFDLTCCRELLHAAAVYVRRYDVPVR